MRFVPFITSCSGSRVSVDILPMTSSDAHRTSENPKWLTSWESEFIRSNEYEKYAVKHDDELIALGAYEILDSSLVVHIIYLEAQPESNPVLSGKHRKYYGIGQLLIAFGIKLSIDNGFGGDVVLEAKTPELAEHYVDDFGAVQLPTFNVSAPRFLIADDAAKRIFFRYLAE